LVNEDRRAKSLDDAAVAAWTAATLEDCRKKGAAEADSINHFGRYMARWREHVFDHATSTGSADSRISQYGSRIVSG
jgi:hypothetical protein